MYIDELTNLVNKRIDYLEIISRLKDEDYYALAIVHKGIFGCVSKMLEKDCKNLIVEYYNKKIKEIEDIIRKR